MYAVGRFRRCHPVGVGRERATAALVLGALAALVVGVVPDVPSRAAPSLQAIAPAPPERAQATRPARDPITLRTVLSAPEAAAPAVTAVPNASPARRTALPASDLQGALDQWMSTGGGVDGVVVGVARLGAAADIWVGAADGPAEGTAVRPGDAYGVLSITKTFTEALVLREVAAGRIDLDSPMPTLTGVAAPPAGLSITPRMLLQHSSGLVNYMDAVGYDPNAPITSQEIVSLALHSPLLAPPGSAASYSNTNFHWLGLLLEHVTGSTYAQLVAELASEFGLTNTSVDPASRPGWVGFASGGIRSTVGDITRWAAALFTPGRVLPREQLALLTTVGPLGVTHGLWPVCCSRDPAAAVQSGLSQIVAHGGLLFYPSSRTAVVVHFDKPHADSAERTYAIGSALRAALGDASGGPG
jgi:D-alanyl-D-alanine carboxypeptidase